MKKIRKALAVTICMILAVAAIALVGCNKTIKVESVALNQSAITLTVGQTQTLTATITPADAENKEVEWKSSKESVATVSSGKVTAVAEGTADITVTTKDGGKTATCKVTVTAAPTTLAASMITVATGSVFTGKALTPAVTVKVGETTIANTDYDVTYADNINAGTAKVTVTAKSTSTTISGSATQNFTIAQADATKESFVVTIDPAEKSDKTAQVPVVKFKNGSTNESDYYTLKSEEFTVKYYIDGTGNNQTEVTGTQFTRQKNIVAKIAIVKGKNFKFDGSDNLALDDKTYTIASPADAAFFTAGPASVDFNGATFTNNTNLAIAKATDQNVTGVELYTVTGTATPFADSTTENDKKDTIEAYGVNGVTERDAYIVFTLDNAEDLYEVEMGWVNAPSDELVAPETTGKTASLGYQKVKDHEIILRVTLPENPRYFRVQMNGKVYVLDINGLTTPDFISVNTNTVYMGSASQTDTTKGFKNADNSNLTITKDGDIYKISGKATAFTDTNAQEFDGKALVDAKHSYIVLKLNVKQSETYNGGWVAAPGDALVENTSVGFKKHTIGAGDDDLVLWVTNPKASDLKFFRFEFNGRAFVLDITDLETGSNIFTNETGMVDANGQTTTDNNGFKNDADLTFTEEGNIVRVTGKSTKFTTNNKDKFGGVDAQKDEYIVFHLGFANDVTSYKSGWVGNPDSELGSDATSHSVTYQDSKKDLTMILCVTKPGRTGFFRIEIENSGDSTKKDTRAYVLDLRDLQSSEGKDLYAFFRVDATEESLSEEGGDETNKKFKNDNGSNLAITRVQDTQYNAWAITGKSTKFTDQNKNLFGGVDTSDSYIILTFNVKKGDSNASIKMGWVDAFGETLSAATTESGKTDNNGYKELKNYDENQVLIIWVSRDISAKIFWVEVDGVNYYLDCSKLKIASSTNS